MPATDSLRLVRKSDPDDASDYLLLYADTKLVAYADTTAWGEGRWVYEIAVHPHHRGLGLGTHLLHLLREEYPDEPLVGSCDACVPSVNGWEKPGLSDEALASWYLRHGGRRTPTDHSDRIITLT